MTGRQSIAKRVGIWGTLYFPVVVTMFLGFIVAAQMNDMVALGMLVLMMMFTVGGGIALTIRIVCPHCGKWIAPVTGFSLLPIFRGLPRKVKHCPLCGADFDQELIDREKSGEPRSAR